MKCFTVSSAAAMDGVGVVRSMRPHVLAGSGSPVWLAADLVERMRECLSESASSGQDMIFDPVLREVLLLRCSVEMDRHQRFRLVREADEASRKRALVAFDVNLEHLGIAVRGAGSHLAEYASLSMSYKARQMLVQSSEKASGENLCQSVTKLAGLAVLEEGSQISIAVQWYYIDARHSWRQNDKPARPVMTIEFDGNLLTVTDLTHYLALDWEADEIL